MEKRKKKIFLQILAKTMSVYMLFCPFLLFAHLIATTI